MSEVEDFLQKHAEKLKESSDGEPLETKEKELIDKLQTNKIASIISLLFRK